MATIRKNRQVRLSDDAVLHAQSIAERTGINERTVLSMSVEAVPDRVQRTRVGGDDRREPARVHHAAEEGNLANDQGRALFIDVAGFEQVSNVHSAKSISPAHGRAGLGPLPARETMGWLWCGHGELCSTVLLWCCEILVLSARLKINSAVIAFPRPEIHALGESIGLIAPSEAERIAVAVGTPMLVPFSF